VVSSGAAPGQMAAALARMAAALAPRLARMTARMARMATSSLPETRVGRAHGRCWQVVQRNPMLILMIRGTWNLSTCGGSGT
jgi:hypothetical protein